jgi:transcriptional regulator GlxA family with amidase domain
MLATTISRVAAYEPFHVGVFVFANADCNDISEPIGALAAARAVDAGVRAVFIGESLDPVATQDGIVLAPEHDLASAPRLDAFIIPSGATSRLPTSNRALYEFVRRLPLECLLVSVCTGQRVDRRGRWVGGSRLVDSGRLITASGTRSGIDAALHLLRRSGRDRNFIADVERRLEAMHQGGNPCP